MLWLPPGAFAASGAGVGLRLLGKLVTGAQPSVFSVTVPSLL